MLHVQLRHLVHGSSTANYSLSALHAHETGTLPVGWDIGNTKDGPQVAPLAFALWTAL